MEARPPRPAGCPRSQPGRNRQRRRRHLGRRFRTARPRRRTAGQSGRTIATAAPTDCSNEAFEIVPREEIFASTGLQFMQFNTLYQLWAMRLGELAAAGVRRVAADDARPVPLAAHRRKGQRDSPTPRPRSSSIRRQDDWARELLRSVRPARPAFWAARAAGHDARPAAQVGRGRHRPDRRQRRAARHARHGQRRDGGAGRRPHEPSDPTGATSAPAPGR